MQTMHELLKLADWLLRNLCTGNIKMHGGITILLWSKSCP